MTRPWEHQSWAEPYRDAIQEFDRNKLSTRIEVARKAIDLRIAELWCTQREDMGEMAALQDALHVLALLENVLSLLEEDAVLTKTAARNVGLIR